MTERKLIPSGEELKGKPLFLGINAKQSVGFAKQLIRFGALLSHETKIGERTYPLTGWFGPQGQSIPVVAEYVEAPEMAESGHAKPSVRIFNEMGGAVAEIAVAFKKTAQASGHVFHSGTTSTDPKFEITLNHKREGEPEGAGEPESADQ